MLSLPRQHSYPFEHRGATRLMPVDLRGFLLWASLLLSITPLLSSRTLEATRLDVREARATKIPVSFRLVNPLSGFRCS